MIRYRSRANRMMATRAEDVQNFIAHAYPPTNTVSTNTTETAVYITSNPISIFSQARYPP